MKILRLKAVIEKTGRPKSGIYSDVRNGLLTNPVPIGARAVGWPSDEVDSVIRARIAGKSESEIKALVDSLMKKRLEVA